MDKHKLGQFFTPAWACEVLFDTHFGYLGDNDIVWEPTCGTGNALAAIPSHIKGFGTEIDPELVTQAQKRTGRTVIEGNALTVQLPYTPTAVFGNPPFLLSFFEQLLLRCSKLLCIGQKAGFVIPAYFLQTSRTVMPISRLWTIQHEIIPRDLFYGLSKPLIFGTFIRDNNPRLVGFSLFTETAEIKEISSEVQEMLYNSVNGSRSVWRETVASVLSSLGGKAQLQDIYKAIEGKRPTKTTFWKEQIRKVLQYHFKPHGDGIYSIA